MPAAQRLHSGGVELGGSRAADVSVFHRLYSLTLNHNGAAWVETQLIRAVCRHIQRELMQ